MFIQNKWWKAIRETEGDEENDERNEGEWNKDELNEDEWNEDERNYDEVLKVLHLHSGGSSIAGNEQTTSYHSHAEGKLKVFGRTVSLES